MPLRSNMEGWTLNWPREKAHSLGILLILVVFVLTAVLYAARTPVWQNPDEPAHFNYVRYIWDTGQLPVLQMGDYPHEYLEEIKSRQFPPDMPVDPIRYEFHQPPLYYLLAAPVYGLTRGLPLGSQVLALRLLSIAFGAGFLWVSYRLFGLVFPENRFLALLAAGLAAIVPMHIALTAAVNNDSLANLLLVSTVVLMLRAVRAEWGSGTVVARRWVWAGVVMGLAMLAKSSAYVAIPLGLVIVVGHRWRASAARAIATRVLALFGPALLLNLPWYIRNVLVYGGTDVLGLQRHGAIVLGQPTTAEWVARIGWSGLAREFFATSFRSFWAQFGWMGVLVDARIYQALALVSILLGLGFLLYLLRAAVNHDLLTPFQWKALGVLGLWLLLTVASYLWYNFQFVQHQGRYLFPALPPLALAMALGLEETLRPTRARLFALLCALGIAASLAVILITGRTFKTLSLLLGLSGLAYVVVWRLGPRWGRVWQVGVYLALVVLDFVCLYRFIIPFFSAAR